MTFHRRNARGCYPEILQFASESIPRFVPGGWCEQQANANTQADSGGKLITI